MRKFLIFFSLALILTATNAYAYPDGDWWDPDWKYVKIINISENSWENLTDCQILVNIKYDANRAQGYMNF